MKTDDLVRALAADEGRTARPRRAVLAAAIAGGAAVCALLVALLGVRPDLSSALGDPRVAFKFVFAGSVAAAAIGYALAAMRPEDRRPPLRFLRPVLALLAAAVVAELCLTSSASWAAHLEGPAPLGCVGTILALALPATGALLAAMRVGAPHRPALAGAAAGLGGGAIAAGAFALYCPNDSVLFVAVWYVLALVIAAAAGAAAGRRMLAW